MKGGDRVWLRSEVVGAGGRGFPPVLPAAAAPPGVTGREIEAVPGPRWSAQFCAAEKLSFLADRFR